MLPACLSFALILALSFPPVYAGPLDNAIALYRDKKYPEARAALEKLAAAEPTNAAAAYYYGMTLRLRGDQTAIDDAVPWLAKAVELEPDNATYLADFGGSSMQLAGKTRSLSAANRGRDAMLKAIELNPENLQAREGIMQFYSQAPWPIGSSSKAYAQAEEIRKRDATRGLIALITLKSSEKKYAEASALCEEVLRRSPDDFPALYQVGRLASISGDNLDRGLYCLRRCLALTPPPNQPGHVAAHYRIGVIMEKKADKAAARVAYESALRLDPKFKPALDAVAKL